MGILKNKLYQSKHFVIIVTSLFTLSCSNTFKITKIQGQQININQTTKSTNDIEEIIHPYRSHINKDLDSILSYNPELLDKSNGQWQTNIGSWMAEITFARINEIFTKRYSKNADACILNHGGIRSIIPKGPVSARNAYEVMPFENEGVVVGITGDKVDELIQYFVKENKPHPLFGIQIHLNKNGELKSYKINNEILDKNKIYYIITSDYLANGGDRMDFFRNPKEFYKMDYKLRNLIIDDFKQRDTLSIPKEPKVIQ